MFEKVQEIIAKELGLDKEKVTKEARLTEDLGADSLDAVEIIMALEEEFDIQVDDSNFQNIKCVEDIVKCLESIVK
jgi:acyl carrier protein